jgi:hypothetical protein
MSEDLVGLKMFAPLGRLAVLLLLQINREVDVRHAAPQESRAAGQVGHILNVRRPHHPRV